MLSIFKERKRMKKALVDLGSNTVRLSVYQVFEDGSFSLLFSEKEMAGLVNYISDKRMSVEGFDKAWDVIWDFKKLMAQFDISELNIFATASLRNIVNKDEALTYIKEKTGENINIISGKEEAELGYYGAISETSLNNGIIFDIGGGSTEIVEVREGKILRAQSLPLGSLNLFRSCVSKIWPKSRELDAMRETVERTLTAANLPLEKTTRVCGVGGTARAVLKIANAWYGRPELERRMTPKELHQLTKALQKQDERVRQMVLNNCPDRIHTILPGALLMDAVSQALCRKELYISRTGVREGYLYHRILREYRN